MMDERGFRLESTTKYKFNRDIEFFSDLVKEVNAGLEKPLKVDGDCVIFSRTSSVRVEQLAKLFNFVSTTTALYDAELNRWKFPKIK